MTFNLGGWSQSRVQYQQTTARTHKRIRIQIRLVLFAKTSTAIVAYALDNTSPCRCLQSLGKQNARNSNTTALRKAT